MQIRYAKNGELATALQATFASIIDSVDATVDETEKVYELGAAGIDITELEFMDEDERREAI